MVTEVAYSPMRVAEVAFDVERRWIDATAESGAAIPWPFGYCVETCVDLVEVLGEEEPAAGAVYVWGRFRVDQRARRFAIWRLSEAGVWEPWGGHAWVELVDGTIIDPTAGQFTGGPPLAIVPPDGDAQARYQVVKRETGGL